MKGIKSSISIVMNDSDSLLSRKFILLWALLLLISLYSCSGEDKHESSENIKYGGILKIVYADPIENLDPQKIIYDNEWYISNIVYEGLVGYSSNPDSLLPALAESWEKHDGGKRWIFKIRNQVKFHDDPCFPDGRGRILNVNDIVFMFERICGPESGCLIKEILTEKIIGAGDYFKGKASEISGIKIIADNKIQIELTKPYVTFLKLLASPYAFIIPKEAVDYYGNNFSKHPVGTGAFRMTRWKEWQEIYFAKNEKYWAKDKSGGRLPYLDGIKIVFLSSGDLAITEFYKGENQLLYVDGTTYHNLKSEKDFKNKYDVASINTANSIRFFGFAMDKNNIFAKNRALRKAVALSFNRSFLITDSLQKIVLANSLAPAYFLNDNTLRWHIYDSQSAAGIANKYMTGKNKIILKICSSITSPDVVQLVSSLNRIGIEASSEINAMNYYEYIVGERPDMFRVSMKPVYPDPEEYYSLFYSKSDKFINLCGYKNDRYDAFFEKSMVEQNPADRRKLFVELERILFEDIPAIYLSHVTESFYVYPRFIKNLHVKCSVPDYRVLWMDKKQNEE